MDDAKGICCILKTIPKSAFAEMTKIKIQFPNAGNNRNTKIRCEICSKLTIKILERLHWRHYFEHNFTTYSSASIANFKEVNAG